MLFELGVIIALILLFILGGAPVSFALGSVGVLSILLFESPTQLFQFGSIALTQSTNMNQLVIPLFVLMAEFLAQGGIAADIFEVINRNVLKLKIKGGLAVSAILGSTVFAALCGSSTATAAAIGRVSISEMIRHGYRQDFAAGTVAAGGTLGIMIPPSIVFVLYGIITETSIAKLLIAGIIPGLMLSLLLIIFIVIRSKMTPSLTEAGQAGSHSDAMVAAPLPDSETPSRAVSGFKLTILPMLLILLVLGSLYTGLATPTESAGFGAIGSLIVLIILRRLSKKLLLSSISAAAKMSVMVLFLVIGGMCLSYAVSLLGIPQTISETIANSGLNKWVVLALVYLLWFVLGCLMDPGSMVILTVPFLYPTMVGLGFDPIWLGVVSTLSVEIGMITPPVGLNLFVLKGITNVPMDKIISGSLPFVGVMLLGLLLITLFPQIALWLPSMM